MTDVMAAPKSQRRGLIEDKETQRKLIAAGGVSAGTAAGIGATPYAAQGVKLVSPNASAVNRAAAKLASSSAKTRLASAALSTSLVGGALGATNAFSWNKRMKKETKLDTKRVVRAERVARAQSKLRSER